MLCCVELNTFVTFYKRLITQHHVVF